MNVHTPRTGNLFLVLATLLLVLGTSTSVYAREFKAEGSDSGAGIGARYIALGGSGVAISDDVYAAYYNPAGLAEIEDVQISVSRQLNADLRSINFLGIAGRLPIPSRWGFKATLAGVYYPRIHARASGAFKSSEIESVFLRYLLPGMPGDFDGKINSKTKVYRLAFSLAPAETDTWSVGVNIDRIDCKTNFCGTHATSNGYTAISTGAVADSFGLSFRYRPMTTLVLAGTITDLGADLNVDIDTTDSAGTRHETHQVAFPKKVTLGAAYDYSPSTRLTAEYEILNGNYGKQSMNIQNLRFGAEHNFDNSLSVRFGLMAMLKATAENVEKIDPPFPVAPTLGVGWRGKHLQVDLGVYAHPLMSLHEDDFAPAADLSLTANF